MAGKNKTPLLGWHPPAELSAWVRDEAKRRGVNISVVLNEALAEYRKRHNPAWVPLQIHLSEGQSPATPPSAWPCGRERS